MKKLFLTIAAFSALTFSAAAQNGNRTAQSNQAPQMTAEQRADKQTEKIAAGLNLSDAQKSTFKKLALERINANTPLKEKAKAPGTSNEEKKTLHDQIMKNNDKFFTSVNSMLTPEQQTKWIEHKKKMQGGPRGEHQD